MFGRRLRAMDEQLKLAAEARSIAQQTRSNLQMRFEMLELGLDGREASLGEILDAVQQLDGRLEDVEENVTMLDIEAALAEATGEAMGCDAISHACVHTVCGSGAERVLRVWQGCDDGCAGPRYIHRQNTVDLCQYRQLTGLNGESLPSDLVSSGAGVRMASSP